MSKPICPKCGAKDPVIAVMPRIWVTRSRGDLDYKARLPRSLKCLACNKINPQWHFNAAKLNRFKTAKRGRPKGSKNKPEPEAVPCK